MKKWLTGETLQGVMGQVVGCGVVNVMVGLSVYNFAYCIRLVVHVQTLYHQFGANLIPTNSRCDEIWYAVFSKGVDYLCT
jgi:hypothetical protein